MNPTELVLSDLDRAEHAFNRVIGKHTIEEALELLVDLNLETDVQELIYSWIEKTFARDAFAGYLRYDTIVQLIQIEKIQLKRQPQN